MQPHVTFLCWRCKFACPGCNKLVPISSHWVLIVSQVLDRQLRVTVGSEHKSKEVYCEQKALKFTGAPVVLRLTPLHSWLILHRVTVDIINQIAFISAFSKCFAILILSDNKCIHLLSVNACRQLLAHCKLATGMCVLSETDV